MHVPSRSLRAALAAPLLLTACAVDEPAPPEALYLRTSGGVLPVLAEHVDDDTVLIHDDILVRVDDLERNRIEPDELERLERGVGGPELSRAAARAVGAYRWPNGVVRFELDADLTQTQLDRVNAAIEHWRTSTGYTFTEASQGDRVVFGPGSGCSSFVGRQGGAQDINVGGCGSWGSVAHEIGHAVGLWHEQARTDRDQFVTIHWDNIIEDKKFAFQTYIVRGEDGHEIGPYDYGSIMHYPRAAFRKPDVTGDTMTPIQADADIGQRDGLSRWDIYAAERLRLGRDQRGPGPEVVLYRDPSFQGASQGFSAGEYRASDGMLDVVGNDQASSIQVPMGLTARLCQTDGAVRICRSFHDDAATLPAGYDNNVSMIEVKRAVTVFRDNNLAGVSQTFPVGNYDADDLDIVGTGTISSLFVPPGLVAELCKPSGMGISCKTFQGQVNFVGDVYNDKVDRIHVKAAVTLFQNPQLGGVRRSLTLGTWTQLGPVTAASSLVVGDGLRARLCDGVDGSGPCATFRGDVTYVGNDLNDLTSWVKVEANTTP